MLDAFQSQEQFERKLIGPAAILPAIVREQGFDAQAQLLDARGPPPEAVYCYTTGQRQIGYSSPGRLADTLSTPLSVPTKKVSMSSSLPGDAGIDTAESGFGSYDHAPTRPTVW